MSFRSRIPSPLLAVIVAVGLAIVAYGGGNVAALAGVLLLDLIGVELTLRRSFILSVVSIQLLFFTGVSIAYLRSREWSLSDIGLKAPSLEGWIVLAAGFVAMIVLWLAASITTFFLGQRFGIEPDQQMIFEIARQDPMIFLLLGALSLLIVGPAEELLFRGVIQTRLRETFGAGVAIALATAIFALIHIAGYESLVGGLLGVSVLFVVGLVLALAYEYTGNLIVVALMHGLFNATQAALGYIGVRFGDPDAMSLLAQGLLAVS